MISVTKENITYRHYFSPAEQKDNARNLAEAQVAKVELEDEKKGRHE